MHITIIPVSLLLSKYLAYKQAYWSFYTVYLQSITSFSMAAVEEYLSHMKLASGGYL